MRHTSNDYVESPQQSPTFKSSARNSTHEDDLRDQFKQDLQRKRVLAAKSQLEMVRDPNKHCVVTKKRVYEGLSSVKK